MAIVNKICYQSNTSMINSNTISILVISCLIKIQRKLSVLRVIILVMVIVPEPVQSNVLLAVLDSLCMLNMAVKI